MALGPSETQSHGHEHIGVVRFGISDAGRLTGQIALEARIAAGEALAQGGFSQLDTGRSQRLARRAGSQSSRCG